jgi:hypothetical protein
MKKNNVFLIILLISIIFACIFVSNFIMIYHNRIENFDINDIKIFDDHEDDSFTYNIGDLFNMPHCAGMWGSSPHHDNEQYDRYKKSADYYKNSILNIYDNLRENEDEAIPNIKKIRESVDVYIENNRDNQYFQELLKKVDDENVLCVHLRNGEYNTLEKSYINLFNLLKKKYDRIILLCGIQKKIFTYPNTDEYKQNLVNAINTLVDNDSNNVEICIEKADYHLSMMHKCKNLMIHKKGFSSLGAFLFTGNNLYLDKDAFELYMYNQAENKKWVDNIMTHENRIFKNLIIYPDDFNN